MAVFVCVCVYVYVCVVVLNGQVNFTGINIYNICRKTMITGLLHGVTFAISQSLIFFVMAVIVPFGAYQITRDANNLVHLTFQDFFQVTFAVGMAGLVLGKTTSFIPKYITAKVAASRVFMILEREPLIDVEEQCGIVLVCSNHHC